MKKLTETSERALALVVRLRAAIAESDAQNARLRELIAASRRIVADAAKEAA